MSSAIGSSTTLTGAITKDSKAYLDDLMSKEKTNPLKANQEMGRDQFLHILLTQLANQNPLDPLQDKDFIAQMAQFSSLESMQSLNKNFETMMGDVKSLKTVVETGSAGQGQQAKDMKALLTAIQEQSVALKQISEALKDMKGLQLDQLNLLYTQAQAAKAYGE